MIQFSMQMNREKIINEMKRLGWSQQDLASKMKVDRQYVWWALQSDHNHTLKTIERFARAIEINPRDLIT